jgi:hypothetical protein
MYADVTFPVNATVVFARGRWQYSLVFLIDSLEDLREQVQAWQANHTSDPVSHVNFNS